MLRHLQYSAVLTEASSLRWLSWDKDSSLRSLLLAQFATLPPAIFRGVGSHCAVFETESLPPMKRLAKIKKNFATVHELRSSDFASVHEESRRKISKTGFNSPMSAEGNAGSVPLKKEFVGGYSL